MVGEDPARDRSRLWPWITVAAVDDGVVGKLVEDILFGVYDVVVVVVVVVVGAKLMLNA